MRFPESVDNSKLKDSQRASARLRFLLNHLALYHCDKPGIASVAKKVEVDPSLLHHYIRAGSCSDALAQKIGAAFNWKFPARYFIRPLEISEK